MKTKLHHPNQIFDLGGVLLQEGEANLLDGLPPCVDIELINGKPPKIFNRIFEFVELACKKDCKKDWIIGTQKGCDLVDLIKDNINKQEYSAFFKNIQEKNLIEYGAALILVPEKLVPLTSLNVDGLKCIKKCKENGARILILSNWDPESFALIKNKFPELFDVCEPQDVIIPAHVGFIKPEPEIYGHMIKSLQLDITQTVFVDDSAKNVAGAQSLGIGGIVHRDWKQTEQELLCKG
jgi:FMN phosphatase YigB (HAD superfamily)